MRDPLIVSFGGGINSTAMLIGMKQFKEWPEYILFADTGGEKPETYEFLERMDLWSRFNLNRPITTVSHPKGDTLRDSCFRNGTLPSKAYGFPGCAVKFKHQFMESFENRTYGKTRTITKAIGYHAGETRRSDITEKGRYKYRYPLREWGWGQAECEASIQREGLPVPMKSACYFCPSSKAHEVLWLAENHPELYADAVAMEKAAKAYHDERGGLTKGLGRRWSWEELVANASKKEEYAEPDEIPCMCHDGGGDDD